MSDTMARVGHLQGGRYHLNKTLGQGGFGVTYLAQDRLLERLVVIKELFPQGSVRQGDSIRTPPGMSREHFEGMMGRFVAEARALARFNSPYVVRVQDVFQENGTAFIVMDHLQGRTLMERLRTQGALTPDEAFRMARQLAEALAVIHDAGLLHRDIKPDNVFLTDTDTPVLIDFGAAREYAGGQSAEMSVVLTHGFAPIEQYANTGNFGPYTDLYALAATLLFAITAKLPPVSVARLHEDVPLPPMALTYAPGLRTAITQALAIRPADRPGSAQAFLDLLQRGRDDLGALTFAQAIHTAQQGRLLPVERQRLWAQALLAVYARREGKLPRIEHVDELQYALNCALEVLPLFHDGLELVFGSMEAAAPSLAEDLAAFMDTMRRSPDGLGEFLGAVGAAAALAPQADLPAPGQVWRAPESTASAPLPALSAKFAGFRQIDLRADAVVQVGFAGPVQVAWSLSADGDLRAVHSVSGEPLAQVAGVRAAAATASGLWLARDGLVQRHAFNGTPLGPPVNFPDRPVSAAAHGRSVAVAGRQGLILLCTLTEGEPAVQTLSLSALTRREDPPLDLAFSSDGRLLLVRDTQAVTVLRTQTMKVLRTFTLAGEAVTAVALSADGQRACTAHGRRLLVWDVPTGRELASFQAPAPVTHLFYNPNGRLLGALGGGLYLLDAQSGHAIAHHAPPGGRGTATSSNADGRSIALGSLHQFSLLQLAPTEFRAVPDLSPPPARPEPVPPAVSREVPAPPPSISTGIPAGFLSGLPSTGMPSRTAPPTPPPPRWPSPPSGLTGRSTAPGVAPYRECRLPPQPTSDVLGRTTAELTGLLSLVVLAEGPVHRQEAFRRVIAAHGLGKVGPRLAASLDRALGAAEAAGQVRLRGEFLWPPDLDTPPVRDRSALATRTLDLVCDEEVQAAGRLVEHLPVHERPHAVARVLGFARLTEMSRERIFRLLQQEHA
ncbi:DUF3320 domain-containing protein [Deinococcus aquaedulcis]|uniref:DUF3320 domain-containing protein n=1 Tax=Deinococcus aquaedulcis TaxID=2840455 RepID=UPI001C82CFFE|nr:DUF3320 domain-containing protein [Deinococcus aquaedulcis]